MPPMSICTLPKKTSVLPSDLESASSLLRVRDAEEDSAQILDKLCVDECYVWIGEP